MEAGLGTLTRMAEGALDRALLVVNPSVKSTEVARRAQEIIAERKIGAEITVIANRLRGERDLEEIRSALDSVEVVAVPEDLEIRMADVRGLSPADAAPDSPAVRAVVSLSRTWTR